MGCDCDPQEGGAIFQVSIHAPRVGCDRLGGTACRRYPCVSIHAPRVGCDLGADYLDTLDYRFQFTHPVWGATLSYHILSPCYVVSIHAPRVGCDTDSKPKTMAQTKFQFTHPVWGATSNLLSINITLSGFNSRTPCGVRQGDPFMETKVIWVSIHAPRVGCDTTRR